MNIKNFLKISVILPVVAGIIIGTVLFLLGEAEDAPGLCLIGLIIAFLLLMLGAYNAGFVNKRQVSCILPFCFGAGGIFLSVVLQLDGELKETPAVFYIGLLLGVLLIGLGLFNLMKYRRSKKG